MRTKYNIHNIVKIDIETKRAEIIKEYEYYMRDFKVDKIDDADIEIRDFKGFKLPPNYFNIANNFFGFENGIYDRKNCYAIEISKDKMRVFAKDSNLCLNTLIEYFLLKKGYSFIHAAGISYNGKGVVFPAPPNTGKTILVSKMRNKENVKFFGDDFVIVGRGKLYSYPSDFSIYKYHFNFFPELKKTSANLKIKKAFFEKLIVNIIKGFPIKRAIKRFANLIGYDYLMGGEYLKVPAKNLILPGKMGRQTNLDSIVLLEKYNGNDVKYENIRAETAAKEMTDILKLEWKNTLSVLKFLSHADNLDENIFFSDIERMLIKEIEKIKIHKVFLPERFSNEQRVELVEQFLEKFI